MKFCGVLKVCIAVLIDLLLFSQITEDWTVGAIICAGLLLYAWLGEYFSLLKEGAVSAKYLEDYERDRLESIMSYLKQDVQNVSGIDISRLKLHLIPSDELNAYAYGIRNMGITRGILNICDDAQICGVLGHEISHIICLDAFFHRIILGNVLLMMLWLSIGSMVCVVILGVVFLCLCIGELCGGFVSIYLFRGFTKMVKGLFNLCQQGVLFCYQVLMGIISRRAEFRADRYSCQLGYGLQLSEFLSRYILEQELPPKSIGEILYSSHPNTYKRIANIKQTVEMQYPVPK